MYIVPYLCILMFVCVCVNSPVVRSVMDSQYLEHDA